MILHGVTIALVGDLNLLVAVAAGCGVLVQVLQNPPGRLPASQCHGKQNAFQVSTNRNNIMTLYYGYMT